MSVEMCICIPTHAGRFELLTKVLAALDESVRASGLVCEVRLFPDAPGLNKAPSTFKAVPIVLYEPSAKRLHADLNIIRARAIAFEESAADIVLSLDDDILVTPSFIGDLYRATRWASAHRPAIVQSSITCVGSLSYKAALRSALCIGFSTGTHYCMDRRTFHLVQPLIDEYAQRFLKAPPQERDNDAIRKWLYVQAQNFTTVDPWTQDALLPYLLHNTGTTHDAVTLLAALLTYTVPCHLAANRAITIGATGSTMSPEQYTAHQHVKLDPLPPTTHFRWFPAPHRAILDGVNIAL